MNNLIQSYHYKFIRCKYYYLSIPIALLFIGLSLLSVGVFSHKLTMSEIIPNAAPMLVMGLFESLVGCVPGMFGQDYMDKTICLDILAGHAREKIYISRIFVAFLYALSVPLLVCIIPIGIGLGTLGFGDSCDARGLLIRFLLLLFLICRVLMEVFVLTSITKNALAGTLFAVASLFVGLIGGVGIHLIYPNYFVINGIFYGRAIIELGTFNSKMGFVDGRDITFFDAALEPQFVTSLVVTNIVLIVLFFVAGLIATKKSDF